MSGILFRAKRLDNNEWIEGHYIFVQDAVSEEFYHCIVKSGGEMCVSELWDYEFIDKDTLSAFTGLVDKNGRKLFDGDIVRETVTSYYQPIGKICYNVENCQWRIEYVNNIVTFSSIGSGRIYELLGNIYDTPMLLENAECTDINYSK